MCSFLRIDFQLVFSGLERVAEELMGRRKWKQYQETLMRTHLNSDQFVASIEDSNIELKKELDKFESGELIEISRNHENSHLKDKEKIIAEQQNEHDHKTIKHTQEFNKEHLQADNNRPFLPENNSETQVNCKPGNNYSTFSHFIRKK